MTARLTFKLCANCGTKASRLARVCKPCGGKAIWEKPTCEQVEAEQAKRDRMEDMLQKFIATGEF